MRKNKNNNNEILGWIKIIEQQNFDDRYTLYNIESNVKKIKEQLNKFEKQLNEIQDSKSKHTKSDEDEVIEIFNDLISDLDNVNVTITKKDN